ncbi:hypothetical protein PN462_00570 [Spirulina sp. CS-785/01]|uniref:hypothetical protein n=1 Tax=Spirulina sp. CS-785/01 TaxID=3021716 RepID=UPI00232FC6D1|nr:hypothetical protein [Spirulina sp. CS-785/01]MDB9311574.1 hypothetical protein [Spirulina sp. CS-785/01]
MARKKSVAHFVAVSDLSKSPNEQQGILLTVEGRGGDTEKNRDRALELINQKWENGEIEAEQFPDGITQDNIFFVPPPEEQGKNQDEEDLPPIVQGAREIIQLTKLQVEVQDAAEEVSPYTSIIEAVLERNRPLTAEEKEMAKDKKYGKTIERMGMAVATQEDYLNQSSGHGQLILNAIAWQLQEKDSASPDRDTEGRN